MQPAPHGFPPTLAHVPLEARLRSKRGWGFGAVGIAALLVAGSQALAFVLSEFTDTDALKFFGGGLVIGAIGVVMQAMRLFSPVTVALQHGQLGVYVGDAFVRAVSPGEVVEYRLSAYNTFREVLAFGVIGIGGLIGAGAYVISAISEANANLLIPLTWAVAAAIACIGLFSNSIWTRIMARHYFIRGSGKQVTVVFQKSDLKRVGWTG